MLPNEWEDYFQRLYDRTVQVLLTAGCDDAQAKAIAHERVVTAAFEMTGIEVQSYPQP